METLEMTVENVDNTFVKQEVCDEEYDHRNIDEEKKSMNVLYVDDSVKDLVDDFNADCVPQSSSKSRQSLWSGGTAGPSRSESPSQDNSSSNSDSSSVDNETSPQPSYHQEDVNLASLDTENRTTCHICHVSLEHKNNWLPHLIEHHSDEFDKITERNNDIDEKRNVMKQYECRICTSSVKFQSYGLLEVHNRKMHKMDTPGIEKPQETKDVDTTNSDDAVTDTHSPTRSKLKVRKCRKVNHEKSEIFCRECGENFESKSLLKLHAASHSVKEICLKCDRTFKNKTSLKRHMLMIHADGKPYACKQCDQKFTNPNHLKIHNVEHTDQHPFMCSICQSVFTQRNSLNVHMRKHTGERPFSCQLCEKSFTRKADLKIHMRTHSGEKPYQCDFCRKAFMVQGDLTRHVRIHTGQRPFSCPICSTSFTQKCSLNTHMKVHGDEVIKNFVCPCCNAQFGKKQQLTRHLHKIHKDQNGSDLHEFDKNESASDLIETSRCISDKTDKMEIDVHADLQNSSH